MAKAAPTYTRQAFFDVARRRAREARVLLDQPLNQKQRDGAVTLALLAAECALKTALLQGLQANAVDGLANQPEGRLFKGKNGHDLSALWQALPTRIKSGAMGEEIAVIHLRGVDRYEHRYGVRRPRKAHAEPLVESAECLVRWMQNLPT